MIKARHHLEFAFDLVSSSKHSHCMIFPRCYMPNTAMELGGLQFLELLGYVYCLLSAYRSEK